MNKCISRFSPLWRAWTDSTGTLPADSLPFHAPALLLESSEILSYFSLPSEQGEHHDNFHFEDEKNFSGRFVTPTTFSSLFVLWQTCFIKFAEWQNKSSIFRFKFGTLVQVPFLFDYFLIIDSKLCGIILVSGPESACDGNNILQILPEMGIGVGCGCILSIGLDRMISVVFSTRYRKFDKHYYHGVRVNFQPSWMLLFILQILGSLIVSYCLFLAYLMIEYYRPRYNSWEKHYLLITQIV